jgi:hypothetical protein
LLFDCRIGKKILLNVEEDKGVQQKIKTAKINIGKIVSNETKADIFFEMVKEYIDILNCLEIF